MVVLVNVLSKQAQCLNENHCKHESQSKVISDEIFRNIQCKGQGQFFHKLQDYQNNQLLHLK